MVLVGFIDRTYQKLITALHCLNMDIKSLINSTHRALKKSEQIKFFEIIGQQQSILYNTGKFTTIKSLCIMSYSEEKLNKNMGYRKLILTKRFSCSKIIIKVTK